MRHEPAGGRSHGSSARRCDRARAAGAVPDLPRAARAAAALPRQRRHLAEARRRACRRWTATTRTCNANIHRGVYRIAEEATAAYEDARRRVAAFVGAAHPREIVFTRNSTEAINLVAYAWGRATLNAGDAIVLTEMEHHSNLVPWHILAAGARASSCASFPVTRAGELDLDGAAARCSPTGGCKLVGVVHVSNVLGTINPVAEIARQAHAAGALVLVDASQSVPHCPVDVQRAGRRLRGVHRAQDARPDRHRRAVGAARAARGDAAVPGRRRDDPRGASSPARRWNELPWKFEAGTMPIAEAVGLGAAVDYLSALGMDAVFAHDRELADVRAAAAGARFPAFGCSGPPLEKRGGVVAFTLDGVHAHDVATVLDSEGVAVRAGHHCAMPLHEELGVPASARASFHCYSLPRGRRRAGAGLHARERCSRDERMGRHVPREHPRSLPAPAESAARSSIPTSPTRTRIRCAATASAWTSNVKDGSIDAGALLGPWLLDQPGGGLDAERARSRASRSKR